MEIKYSDEDFFESNEEIRAFFSDAHQNKNIHSNKFWEIAYVYEGTAVIHTENNIFKLNSGDFILIKPDTPHSITLSTENENQRMWMCCCIFTQKYFRNINSDYMNISELSCYSLYNLLNSNASILIKLSDDNAQNVKHLLWSIAHEYNHYTAGSNYIIKHTLVNLFIYITRIYAYESGSISNVVSKSHEIDELTKYIRSNFGCKLSLEFLAQHMHISKEYLSRYFKKYTGKTISEYLCEIRIEKAMQMLQTTTHSINDICEYCGYSSIGNFQKTFKKITGMSPCAYRRNSEIHKSIKNSKM